MARKDDLKLLFNFMIELLKEEQETEKNSVQEKEETKYIEPKEFKDTHKQVLKEKQDESAKHILDVMKRVEILDKIRKPRTIMPLTERDEEEIAKIDKEIIRKNGVEKTMDKIEKFKNALKDAKEFMVELEVKKPLVPSASLHELNENETKRLLKEDEKTEKETPETKPVSKKEKTSRKRK